MRNYLLMIGLPSHMSMRHVYDVYESRIRTVNAPMRLRRSADLPEPSLVACVVSIVSGWFAVLPRFPNERIT